MTMTDPVTLPALDAAVSRRVARRSALRRMWRSLWRAKWPLLALAILAVVVIAALFGPWLAPHDPNRQNIILRLQPPFTADRNGAVQFWLGTDALGRDVLSRLIYGARISLAVGLVSVMVGGALGITLGLVAGYYGGRIDDAIMRLADIQLAFPFILLAIMFLVVLGPGVMNLILVLGISQWVTYARMARGATMSTREKEYVEAAGVLGASDGGRIRHPGRP